MTKLFAMTSTRASLTYTALALRSFMENTEYSPDDQIIVIDNDTGSFRNEERLALTEIIQNPTPSSFASNMNLALERALQTNADLYFLNNDLVFTKDWLTPLRHIEDAIVSPVSNREFQYETPNFSTSISMDLSQYSGNEKNLEKLAQIHRLKNPGYLDVFVLPFFCVKIPIAINQKLGKLDLRFGNAGAEDFDYCLRAHQEGVPVRYALSSYLLHFGGKSSWSGVEISEQKLTREKVYLEQFIGKWGNKLAELAFNDTHYSSADDSWLAAAIKRKAFAEIVDKFHG